MGKTLDNSFRACEYFDKSKVIDGEHIVRGQKINGRDPFSQLPFFRGNWLFEWMRAIPSGGLLMRIRGYNNILGNI